MTTPPPPIPPVPPMPEQGPTGGSNDDKTMALISHFGIIIFGFLPALIIYFVKGDSPWVKKEAAKAFNFAIIPTAISWFITLLYTMGVFNTTRSIGYGYEVEERGGLACIFILVSTAIWIATSVFAIINGIKINDGKETKYPVEVPILK